MRVVPASIRALYVTPSSSVLSSLAAGQIVVSDSGRIICGTQAVYGAEEQARRLVSEKYGNHIDFRGASNCDSNGNESYVPISSINISAGNNGDQSLDMSIWN